MKYLRRSHERGHATFSWLDSKHSFSFGHYYDPKHMGFSVLRVINDDTVAPGAGFDTHGHRDMEIISYILKGAIEHKDSEGNSYIVPEGDVQRMTAGTGIRHSEFNHSQSDELKFLQIWIQPNIQGIKPGYEQKRIEQNGKITTLVSQHGENDSLSIHQDMTMQRLVLAQDDTLTFSLSERAGYLHIIEGNIRVDVKTLLSAGDGLGIENEDLHLIADSENAVALWFDLPSLERT